MNLDLAKLSRKDLADKSLNNERHSSQRVQRAALFSACIFMKKNVRPLRPPLKATESLSSSTRDPIPAGSRRVSLKDLAVACGLSTATVSLALRNQGRISTATRKKVLSLANKLGYRPDPLVSKLMSHLHRSRGSESQGVLALLTCYENSNTRKENYLRWTLEGARIRTEKLGYRLEEFSLTQPGMSAERIGCILQARNILGILVAPLRENITSLNFDFTPFAAVTLSFTLSGEQPLHATLADEFYNMKLILKKLQERGYRRIGFALEEEHEKRSNHRWTGAFLTEQLHGLQGVAIPPLIYPGWNKRHLQPWLEKFRPDVVISTEPFVLRWLEEFGYQVPRDIAFVTTSYASSLFDRPISGIDERPEVIGASAVDLLVAHLQRNEFGIPAVAKEVNLPGVWTGDQTAPPRTPETQPVGLG